MMGNSLIEVVEQFDGKVDEKPDFDDVNAEYSWFCDVCDVLKNVADIDGRILERSQVVPRTEVQTKVETRSRYVATESGVSTETVTKDVKEEVVVGEKKITTGFYLNIGNNDTPKTLICAIAQQTGLEVSKAPAFKEFNYILE